jgi:hypothetical protein
MYAFHGGTWNAQILGCGRPKFEYLYPRITGIMTDNVSIKDVVGLIERLEDSLRKTVADLSALRSTEVLVAPLVQVTPDTLKVIFPDAPTGKKRGPKPYSEMTAEEIAAAKARKAANKATNSVKEPQIIRERMIGAPEAMATPMPVAVPAPVAVAAPSAPTKPKRVIKLKK